MDELAFTFRKSQRIGGKSAFNAVFEHRQRSFQGPLGVYVLPNGLPITRLGISVSRRIGIAPVRVRFKRLIREAFRLSQHTLPSGYDVVVVPKPHRAMALSEYQTLLCEAIAKACAKGGPTP